MSKLAFLKENYASSAIMIITIIFSLIGIFMIFNSYSIGLFDNYYELTDDEGLGLIILLILVVILNLSNIIIKAAKRGSIAYKYPR